jgi:hypothetical protein
MGMKLNPATGQMEDDGIPDPAGVLPVAPIFPPKAAHEVTVTSEQRAPSAQSLTAAKDVALTTGAKLSAQEAVGQVEVAEAGIRNQAAGDEVTELERAKGEAARQEAERAQFREQSRATLKQEIEEDAKKKIAAGRGRADFWKGNATGEVLAAFLRGIDRAASSFRGETGPTGVDRIIEAKIDAHEKALVAEWEASKEAHEKKAADRATYEIDLEKLKIFAAQQSGSELKLYAARRDKAIAALGPERAKAFSEMARATDAAAEARLDQRMAQSLDKIQKFEETRRSPTATAASSAIRPLSTETKDIASGADEYARLQARQEELLAKHNGFPGLDTEDGQEFDTNDKAMATVLQKPLGKSDSDAEKAEHLQNAPGKGGVFLQMLGRQQGVKNYKTTLRVNANRLKKDAETRLGLEGRGPIPGGAPPAADWQGVTKTTTFGTYEKTGPGLNDWKKIK